MLHKPMRTIPIAIFSFVMIFLASCGSSSKQNDPNQQLDEYRRQQAELNSKIEALQQQLNESSTAEAKNTIPVVLETLVPITFNHFFEAGGTVTAANEAFISPEMSGQIREVIVKEGDFVKKGQVLARLNTDVTERSIDELKTALSLARDVYERQQRLWNQKIGSELQFLEAKNNVQSLENRLSTLDAQLRMSVLTAPIEGVVEKVHQKKGELATPGMPMIHVVNLRNLLVRADVSERYAGSVRRGDKVMMTIPSFPDFLREVTISRTGNVVNRNNRTFEIEIEIDNTGGQIKPNMVAVLNINDYTAAGSIVVPSRIIKEDLKGKYLYVAEQQGSQLLARKRYVSPDRTYLGNTRIAEGLVENESIIIEGFNRVSDGSIIRIASAVQALRNNP